MRIGTTVRGEEGGATKGKGTKANRCRRANPTPKMHSNKKSQSPSED